MTRIYNVSRTHKRFVLVKAEIGSSDWWYECSSDDENWINERAMVVRGYCGGMWVWVIDTDETEIPVDVL